MNDRDLTPTTGARTLLVLACLVVVVAGLKAASVFILPLLVALFLGIISLPLLHVLQRRRVPTALAVGLTVVVDLALLGGVVTLVGGSIQGFIERAPQYRERLATLAGGLAPLLERFHVDVSQTLLTDLIDPGMAFDFLSGALRGAAAVLSQAVVVLLLVVLFLFEAASFERKLEIAFGRRSASARFEKIRGEILHYVGIKTLVSLATGMLVAAAMAALGIDFPLLWGLLAFLLNYVPNLGSILAAVPPVLLGLVQYGVGRALGVAAVFVAVNMVLGNVVEPYFMGRRLGLSTLVVFLSLVFWGWVWGPIGMFLSVPLTMIVKIMLENTEDLRWVAVLLDAGVPEAARKEAS